MNVIAVDFVSRRRLEVPVSLADFHLPVRDPECVDLRVFVLPLVLGVGLWGVLIWGVLALVSCMRGIS